MSKQRHLARAERQAAAAARAVTQSSARAAAAAGRLRRERRALRWRHLRLWQNRSDGRQRERRGTLAIIVLLVLLVVFVVTRSWAAVLVAALVCVIATPVLALLVDGRRK